MNLTTQATADLTPQQAEQRRDRLASMIKWGAFAGVIVVVAPLLFMLLAATVAAVAAAVIGFTAVALAPVFSMKLANWKLRLIMEEARKNPIPTLENELMVKRKALKDAGEHLEMALGHVTSFIEQAEDAARQYPDMAGRWRERARKAGLLAERKKQLYQTANAEVNTFARLVDQARTEWKLVKTEAALTRSLHLLSGDPMSNLKSREALDEVSTRMNAAFASLEVGMLESVEEVPMSPATKSIGHQDASPLVGLNVGSVDDAVLVTRKAQ